MAGSQAQGQKHSTLQKYGQGVGDIVEGTEQLGLNAAAKIFPSLQPVADKNQNALDIIENIWQRQRADSGDTGTEVMRSIGRGVALAPFGMAIPRAAAGVLPGMAENLAQGTVSGGLSPVTNTVNYARDKAAQIGATTGLNALPFWPQLAQQARQQAGQ